MPKERLGVVLLIPPPLDREIDALRKACDDGALGRIPPHITLVPPVNVRDDRIGDAHDVVRAAAAHTRPFTVTLGPPTTFLPVNPVLYLGVEDPEDEVQTLRDAVFVTPLARPLSFPFVPHVTLSEELDHHRLLDAERALCGYVTEVTFDRIHVLQEGPGRVWEPIADAPFAAPAVVGRGPLQLDLTVTDTPDWEAKAFEEREWPLYDVAETGQPWHQRPFAITARREGRVVGVATGWTEGGVAYLSGLIVAAEHRGEGIGSHLLRAFESLAVERDAPRLALRTLAGSGAERFYRDRGWVEEGRLSPWKYGREQVYMRRDL
jgi:2'-5' RNA ligase/ribosomal protein S18 acetylase RimI-like enzyme